MLFRKSNKNRKFELLRLNSRRERLKRYLGTFLVLVQQSECWTSGQNIYLHLSTSLRRSDKNHTSVIQQDSSITETSISDGLIQAVFGIQDVFGWNNF